MNNIHVEQIILDKNFYKVGVINKTFLSQGDFNSWYSLTKNDPYSIINIMKYNPQDFPGQKITNDLTLAKLPKGVLCQH